MNEKDLEKIENYLVAIMALAEKSNNEYTDSILQLIRDEGNELVKEIDSIKGE